MTSKATLSPATRQYLYSGLCGGIAVVSLMVAINPKIANIYRIATGTLAFIFSISTIAAFKAETTPTEFRFTGSFDKCFPSFMPRWAIRIMRFLPQNLKKATVNWFK